MSLDSLFQRNIQLSNHSSYQIGGVANFFAAPETIEELIIILTNCQKHGLQYFFCGMGSNLLFPDDPPPDTVYISLKKLVYWTFSPTSWFISAGMPMSMLSLAGLMHGIAGLDFTYLLPGSVGAGIFMNAKYGNHQMSDIVKTVYYIDLDDPAFSIKTIDVSHCGYGYKQSIFQKNPWMIVGADMAVFPERVDHERSQQLLSRWNNHGGMSELPSFYNFMTVEIQRLNHTGISIPAEMISIEKYRNSKLHFTSPSCGSVFKNNYNYGTATGALVDQLNLRGLSHGAAEISPLHGNMILNKGGAKASDVLYLISTIQEQVHQHFGFIPEPEVVIVN